MKITLNEQDWEITAGFTLGELRDLAKPAADVLIRNGFPSPPETPLEEGDSVVLITRGETPSRGELEVLLRARHTPGTAERLKAAVVGIAGLGGLGSQVGVALARVGIGRLVLVDFDVVEPSNLNRQHYFMEQLGQPKTQALADTLRKINPFIQLETHQLKVTEENILELFSPCSVVVEAFDGAEQKMMLITTLMKEAPEKFIVAGSGMAGHGHSNDIRLRRAGRLFVVGDETRDARPGRGLMAPRVGIAAHMQANTAMEILLDIIPKEEEQEGKKGEEAN